MKKALITGITGQDGSYLAELLLGKGYEVHGLIRRASTFNTARIDHLYVDPHEPHAKLFLHYADLSDGARLVTLLSNLRPDEVSNLARQTARAAVLRRARTHSRDHWDLHHSDARGGAPGRHRDALLPGVLLRALRLHTPTAERTITVPSALPLRGVETVQLLDHPQLSG